MPAAPRASGLLLMGVAAVFLGGIAFGAVAALTQKRPEVAKATATEPAPEPTPEPTPEPKPAPPKVEPKKPDPPKKSEPKPTPKPEKKPDPPKPKPEPKPEPKAEPVSYEKQVFPVFKQHCLLCHGDPQKKADLDLKTLAAAVKGGDNGPGATAGKLDKSTIWERIDDGTMPPDGRPKLSAAEKKLVMDWILGGAK